MGRVVNRMSAVHPGEVLRAEYLAPSRRRATALPINGFEGALMIERE